MSRDLATMPDAGDKLALLARLGQVLGASLDYDQVLQDVADALAPAFADLCSIAILDDAGDPTRLARRAIDGPSEPLLRELRGAALPARVAELWTQVLSTGRARIIPDCRPYLPADEPEAGAFAAAVARFGVTSALLAPLVVRGRSVGMLNLGMLARSARGFHPGDAAFAEELGQRVGLALDNARLHTQLRVSEARLQLALQAAPVRVFSQDLQLRFTWVQNMLNPGGRIPAEAALGKTDVELLPPAVAAHVTTLKRGVIASGIGAREVVGVPVGTDVFYYDLTIEPLRDGAGQIVGVTGASWDVTEQRRLVAQRAAAEARTRRLIEDAPEPYLLADPRGRFVDVNPAACALLGYTREELLGMSGADLIVADDAPRLAAAQATAPGTVSILAWRLRRKAGELVDVEIHGKVLPDGGWQGFARDITDRRRVERDRERVLVAEQRLRSRLEALREATLAISAIDEPTPGVANVLQRVVDEARRLAGADYAALGVGTDPAQPFAPWVTSGVAAEVIAAIGAPPHPRHLLGWVVQHDQPVRLARVQAHGAAAGLPAGHAPIEALLSVPVTRDGRAIGNLFLARRPGAAPFTEEDEAMVALLAGHAAIAITNARLYDERQAAVRAREDVIAIVSHDLKNPLNAIELREVHLARSQTDPKLVAHAGSVRRAVATMQRMIQSLLDSTGLDRGGLRLELGAHDLRELVDDVVEGLTPIAADKGVRIEVRIPALGPQRCDRERFLQLLYNLTGNAVKFSPAGGVVEITAVPRDHELEVAVADTGPGIAPDALPRIFERYFTTEAAHHGLGLGLYLARGVVEAHGGRLWVESTPGQGSAFRFTLPR